MSRISKVLKLAMVMTAIMIVALPGTAIGCGCDGDVGLEPGPAPNSGDGVPDGSGF